SDQSIAVLGSNFQAGLTVTAFFPNSGGSATLSGTQIQNVTATSFTMLATLNGAGTWGMRVNNPDGQQSSVFNFTVAPPQVIGPTITSISPSSPAATGIGDQAVSVFGSNFQSGLTATVTWPSGSATLTGAQIQNVTSTSFQALIDFG